MYFPQLGLPLGQRSERKTGILLSFFGPQGPLNPAPLDKKTDLFCVLGICVADAATATADIYSMGPRLCLGARQGEENKRIFPILYIPQGYLSRSSNQKERVPLGTFYVFLYYPVLRFGLL